MVLMIQLPLSFPIISEYFIKKWRWRKEETNSEFISLFLHKCTHFDIVCMDHVKTSGVRNDVLGDFRGSFLHLFPHFYNTYKKFSEELIVYFP
jgi:hypothetical protein